MRHHKPDYIFIITIWFLVLFGLAALLSASSALGKQKFNDVYYYFKHQLLFGVSVGAIGFVIMYLCYYRNFQKIALFLLFLNIILLVLLFTPLGFQAGGADRWLRVGPITFQPSELLKITFIFYLAAFFSANIKKSKSINEGLIPFLVIATIIGALLLKQPATGIFVLILASGLIVYFVSGAKFHYILLVVLIGLLVLGGVVMFTPYRLQRFLTYLNPGHDPQGKGYHINQALIAVGSGGLFGVGFGNSRAKNSALPEPIGDSVFAVIAEELGFAGQLFVIALFLIILIRGFRIARDAPDKFGQLATIGIVSSIIIQGLMNIAAISGLLPLTGLPLPFVSYGSTALSVTMTLMGFVANVSRYTLK